MQLSTVAQLFLDQDRLGGSQLVALSSRTLVAKARGHDGIEALPQNAEAQISVPIWSNSDAHLMTQAISAGLRQRENIL